MTWLLHRMISTPSISQRCCSIAIAFGLRPCTLNFWWCNIVWQIIPSDKPKQKTYLVDSFLPKWLNPEWQDMIAAESQKRLVLDHECIFWSLSNWACKRLKTLWPSKNKKKRLVTFPDSWTWTESLNWLIAWCMVKVHCHAIPAL